MKRSGAITATAAVLVCCAGIAPVPAQRVTTRSPDARLALIIGTHATADSPSVPVYSITWRGASIVAESRLGLDFVESGPFGTNVLLTAVSHSAQRC